MRSQVGSGQYYSMNLMLFFEAVIKDHAPSSFMCGKMRSASAESTTFAATCAIEGMDTFY